MMKVDWGLPVGRREEGRDMKGWRQGHIHREEGEVGSGVQEH